MIPREIDGQRIFLASRWNDMIDNVKKFWGENMFITDLDYNNGVYVVVISSVKGCNGQCIRYGLSFPEMM